MRFFTRQSEIVYKLMCTLCQIKIANTSGEHWGIESEHHLHCILEEFSAKFIKQKQLKEYQTYMRKDIIPYEIDITLALHLQFHQLNQVQELSQERSRNLCPLVCLADSS